MLKSLHRLDRRSYWMWTIPLLAGHGFLSIAMVNGVKLLSFDTWLILLLAAVLARRSRDIGWPIRIGPSFLIITMLVLPVIALVYAILSRPAPAEFLQWLIRIGQITGPINLLLLVVAGCMPSKPIAVEAA
jgi:uncharacterized membrane protein YhaH (DUF805 family)